MKLHPYLQEIQTAYEAAADPVKAEGAKAYMLNQFDFFGLKAEVWRSLLKQKFKEQLPPYKEVEQIVKQCFRHPLREMQYTAVELLAKYEKEWNEEVIELIEYMITNKSWWDSVDHAISKLAAVYFKRFPKQIKPVSKKWNSGDNIWLQRSSILFQLKYKKETDTKLLSDYIIKLASSKEFFVQKAIGWALREYAKTDPSWVHQFVKENKLAPLSKREALKHIGSCR
ncbi:MAG: DNA alkylation repair protein [Chitinophagaceae bacterium]